MATYNTVEYRAPVKIVRNSFYKQMWNGFQYIPFKWEKKV